MPEMICEECRIGRYQVTTATYLQWLEGRMLVFPDAPAYVCDVCRYMKYDVAFIQDVEYVLDRLRQRQSDRQITALKMKSTIPGKWYSSHHS